LIGQTVITHVVQMSELLVRTLEKQAHTGLGGYRLFGNKSVGCFDPY
jgi:hypothetical protein